jgi:hypothetical protein
MAAKPRLTISDTLSLPIIELLRLVWDQRLKYLGLRSGLRGLSALVFDRREVMDLLEAPRPDGWALREARRILRVANVTMTLLGSGPINLLAGPTTH